MKLNLSLILSLFPVIYAASLLKPLESVSFVIKGVLVVMFLLMLILTLFNADFRMRKQEFAFIILTLTIGFFSIQLMLAILSSFLLAFSYKSHPERLIQSAKYLVFFLVFIIILVHLGFIQNELVQEDLDLGRLRYDIGFKYVTSATVLSIYSSCIFYLFGKRHLLLLSMFLSYVLFLETGTRSGVFYCVILLFASCFPYFEKLKLNFVIISLVLVVLSVLLYNHLGFEYLNFLLSDRLAQNFSLFETYQYDPFGALKSDFIFLNIVSNAGFYGVFFIFLWVYLIFGTFTISCSFLLVILISFLTDSGGSIFSLMLMLSFINENFTRNINAKTQ